MMVMSLGIKKRFRHVLFIPLTNSLSIAKRFLIAVLSMSQILIVFCIVDISNALL